MTYTVTVSSLDQLYAALSEATGGETILLEGGQYGGLNLSLKSGFDLAFPDTVTIASADPDNPAIFSTMDVRGAENLTFDGITFDYTFAEGDEIWDKPFSVSGSDSITIRNSIFDGDLAKGVSDVSDGYGYAIGLSVRGSDNITVENNEFFDFFRGSVISESSELIVQGNDMHSLRMDGMNFSEIDGALIKDNYIHDFRGSPNSNDHSDMIQFWTNGTDSPSRDITITGNHLDIGAGSATQSIFMRNDQVDRGLAGSEMFYQNISITDNVIVNAHLHGITVGETAGLTIANNSVLHSDGGNVDGADRPVEIPRISAASASTNVSITNNATSNIIGHENQPGWTLQNNAFVQDQNSDAPGFYGDVFLASSLQLTGGVHNFLALDGGMLDRLDAGATATRTSAGGSDLFVGFHVSGTDSDGALYHFAADLGDRDIDGLPAGTTFVWNFGDGTTATGTEVSHRFASGDVYDASLTVTLPGDAPITRSLPLKVAGPEVLSFAAGSGFSFYESGEATALQTGDRETDAGLDLGGVGIGTSVARNHVAGILGEDSFAIDLTLAADSTGSAGEVMRLHGSFIVAVTSTGELSLKAFTEDGQVRLTTSGANLTDTAAHDIGIGYDNSTLSISVDGKELASAPMQTPLASAGNLDLTFGNAWGGANFEGMLSALEITTNAADFFKEPGAVEQEVIKTPEPVVVEQEVVKTPEPVVVEQEVVKTPEPVVVEQEVVKTPEPVVVEQEVVKTPEPVVVEQEVAKTPEPVVEETTHHSPVINFNALRGNLFQGWTAANADLPQERIDRFEALLNRALDGYIDSL